MLTTREQGKVKIREEKRSPTCHCFLQSEGCCCWYSNVDSGGSSSMARLSESCPWCPIHSPSSPKYVSVCRNALGMAKISQRGGNTILLALRYIGVALSSPCGCKGAVQGWVCHGKDSQGQGATPQWVPRATALLILPKLWYCLGTPVKTHGGSHWTDSWFACLTGHSRWANTNKWSGRGGESVG